MVAFVITTNREKLQSEPSWHRRERRRRAEARTLLRVQTARKVLALHHSAQKMPSWICRMNVQIPRKYGVTLCIGVNWTTRDDCRFCGCLRPGGKVPPPPWRQPQQQQQQQQQHLLSGVTAGAQAPAGQKEQGALPTPKAHKNQGAVSAEKDSVPKWKPQNNKKLLRKERKAAQKAEREAAAV